MSELEKTSTGYYRANQGFATTFEGEPLFVQCGELVYKGHPLLKGREELFEPADTLTRFDRPEIEQATSKPGEKRGARGRRSGQMRETPEEPAPDEPAPEGDDK